MKKAAKELRKQLEEVYPLLLKTKESWFVDREYEIPSVEGMQQVLDKIDQSALARLFKKMREDGDFDCDDLSLQLMAAVRARRPKWPFGEAMGILYEGMSETPHNRDICICREGIKEIDWDTGQVLDPDLENYTIYWVRI